MSPQYKGLMSDVADYFSEKIKAHGPTAQGADWNGSESQFVRFGELSRLLPPKGGFSLGDLGCGYGALCEYLDTVIPNVAYNGYDISPEMIDVASRNLADRPQTHLVCTAEPDRISDYTLASGIFNVRMGRSPDEWQSYITDTIDLLDRTSRHGFAFNCLTEYSEADKMRPDLHYSSPTHLFDLCIRKYSRQVALLHDYKLWEFTILVDKKEC